MRWLKKAMPPRALRCVYCGFEGACSHIKSYKYDGDSFSLYECQSCSSLLYDLEAIEILQVVQDSPNAESLRAARYLLEAGFSSHYVATCVLAALPDTSDEELRRHVFVDIGAGMGMASYFAKTLFGIDTVTVEPSYTGQMSHDILGLDVQRAFFEHLPPKLLADLAQKPCCLHLNSVVEHLVDPFAVLSDMVARANVESLAIIVPDGWGVDFDGPFIAALPFLAPRDHLHLPSKQGVKRLLERLGFAHVLVEASTGLVTGVGSRRPMTFPSDRTIKLSEHVLLENMMRHPNPMVAAGGAARLLAGAVSGRNEPLLADLRERLPFETHTDVFKEAIARRDWDEIPFHLGPSCYWLAIDAMTAGRWHGALSLLDLCESFADVVAADYPQFAMTALEFKWASLLLRSHIHVALGENEAGRAAIRTLLEAQSDAEKGPRTAYIVQAEERLQMLAAAAPEAKPQLAEPLAMAREMEPAL